MAEQTWTWAFVGIFYDDIEQTIEACRACGVQALELHPDNVAGLRDAEAFVIASISKTIYKDPTVGLYDRLDSDPKYIDPAVWAASQTAGTTLPHVAQQPQLIIKYLGDRSQNEVAAVNIGGYGSSQPGITVSNFRITARAVGQTGRAIRQLQAYYGKSF